jgi:hypothetical protein
MDTKFKNSLQPICSELWNVFNFAFQFFLIQPGGPVNLSSVRRYLGTVGRPLSSDAQKMLQSIENYQKVLNA